MQVQQVVGSALVSPVAGADQPLIVIDQFGPAKAEGKTLCEAVAKPSFKDIDRVILDRIAAVKVVLPVNKGMLDRKTGRKFLIFIIKDQPGPSEDIGIRGLRTVAELLVPVAVLNACPEFSADIELCLDLS